MFHYTLRRLLIAIPPLPLMIPPEVKEKMRAALGLGDPLLVRYLLWLRQFFWIEPLHVADSLFGLHLADAGQRVVSWQSRSPVADIIAQRLPQTLWVVGLAYV